ncbi:MAG: PAS domain S-box protein [Oceanospirillaceae bacterium]|nr:PAS domain S-box protein [Oceanospirillaceae bacterium]
MSIKRLLTIIIVSTLSIFVAWQAQRYAYDWSMVTLKEQGESRLLNMVTQFRGALREYKYLPFLISHNRDIKRLLLSDAFEAKASLGRYLEQMNLVAGSTALFILGPTGKVLADSYAEKDHLLLNRSHFNQPYFRQARRESQGFHIALAGDGSVNSLYFSAPIYVQGKFAGVAVVRINFQLLQTKFPFADHFVMSYQNHILLASRSDWLHQQLDQVFLAKELQTLHEGSQVDIRRLVDNRELLLQSVLLSDLHWNISVLSSTQLAIDSGRRAKIYSLTGSVALLLLLLWLRERRLKNISRLETQVARARSEAMQRDMINQAQVGLAWLDASGNIQYINPMIQHLFGINIGGAQGVPVMQLIADESSCQSLKKRLMNLSSLPFVPISSIETMGLRLDKSHFSMLLSIKKMENITQVNYLVTVIDLTQIKLLEHELHLANDQLERKVLARTKALKETQNELVQAEKMAALGRMSSAVVHELNQPLTAIKTYISICRQLLKQCQEKQKTVEGDALSDNFSQINQLSDRMAELTRQLKIFAFKKPERLVAVDLTKSLQQTVLLFSQRLKAQQIELICHLPDVSQYIQGDTARVEQIFYNLIQNACDALGSVKEGSSRVITITLYAAKPADRYIKIDIMDNGMGIAAANLEHLFEPFFTTKRIGEGLGLGLSIVQSIVLDLGGDIQAYNTERGGCCFKLHLPNYISNNDSVR